MKVKVDVQVTLTINFMRRGVSAGFVTEKVGECPVDGKCQLRLVLLFIIRDLNTVNHWCGNRFLALVLWVCVVGALWLLLSPAASERRGRTRAVERARQQNEDEWRFNVELEDYRYGLESDPVVIELEARKLGYGRPGEQTYLLTPEEIRAQEILLTAARGPSIFERLSREIGGAMAPALMLAIFGITAILLFADLRIDDPGAPVRHKSRAKTT